MWLGRADRATMPLDMRSGMLLALLLSGSCAAGATFAPPASAAPTHKVDRKTRAKAARKFRQGERAFRRHSYAAAAKDFEEAYAIAPHPAALFNAAEAHQKAGELTRAANLCARYLHDAPDKDKRRSKANKMIAELTPKLGRVDIDDNGAEDVQIDGKAPELETTFVDPGDHVISGSFDGKHVERHVTVVAGSLEHVLLEPPKPPPEPKPETAAGGAADQGGPHDKGGKKHGGLPPVVVYVGAGATAVLAGVTVWSGLDTEKARSDYNGHPTQAGLDAGRGKQTRTNILIGATAAVGVATAVVGLFATDWKGKSGRDSQADAHMAFGVGPGSVALSGRFRGL